MYDNINFKETEIDIFSELNVFGLIFLIRELENIQYMMELIICLYVKNIVNHLNEPESYGFCPLFK